MLKTLNKIKNKLNKYSNPLGSLNSHLALKKLADGDYEVEKNVKYYCQFASPKLAKDILEKRISAKDDSNWQDFGFLKSEEYEFWCWRACAIICLKMIIDTIGDRNETVKNLIDKSIKLGGYIAHDKKGKLIDKGWYYKPLIALSKEYQLDGKLFSFLSVQNICKEILNKHYVIASVNPEVIRYDKDESDIIGGHVVLVYGFRWDKGKCAGFYLHNPSGKNKKTQIAFIPIATFRKAFAERGFSLWKK